MTRKRRVKSWAGGWSDNAKFRRSKRHRPPKSCEASQRKKRQEPVLSTCNPQKKRSADAKHGWYQVDYQEEGAICIKSDGSFYSVAGFTAG